MIQRNLISGLIAVAVGSAALAQTSAIEISVIEPRPTCLQIAEHALLEATVTQCPATSLSCAAQERVPYDVGGHSVRLYFRRLSPDPEGEFFYFGEMNREGGGRYWTTFPMPEDQPQIELTECWWKVRKHQDPTACPQKTPEEIPQRVSEARERLPRAREGDWLGSCGLEELREWLEVWFSAAVQDTGSEETRPPRRCPLTADVEPAREALPAVEQYQEAAEYYVAIFDADGRPVTDAEGKPVRSDVLLVSVREDCPSEMTALERGWSDNLTVGETCEDQRGSDRKGKGLFHWRCDGVTTRIDVEGIPRHDERCERCVIGRLPAPGGDETPDAVRIARLNPAGAVRRQAAPLLSPPSISR